MDGRSTPELATSFLRFMQQNHGNRDTSMSCTDWYWWRISMEPYPSLDQEQEVRVFLLDRNAINNPPDPSNKVVELEKEGRRALDFEGGPLAYWDFQNQREVVEHGKNQAIIDATANAKAEAEKSKGSAKWSRRYAVATLLIAAYTALVEPLCNPAAPDKESQGRDNAHKDLPEQVAIPALPKPVSDTVKNDSTAFLDTRKKDSAKPK